MQALITRRPARSLVALLAFVILAIGLVSTSQAQTVNCPPPTLKTTAGASEAGGTLITVVIECTGNAQETLEVVVTRGDQTLLKAVLDKTVSGNLKDTDTIHLPPLLEEEICASIDGQKVCTPTA